MYITWIHVYIYIYVCLYLCDMHWLITTTKNKQTKTQMFSRSTWLRAGSFAVIFFNDFFLYICLKFECLSATKVLWVGMYVNSISVLPHPYFIPQTQCRCIPYVCSHSKHWQIPQWAMNNYVIFQCDIWQYDWSSSQELLVVVVDKNTSDFHSLAAGKHSCLFSNSMSHCGFIFLTHKGLQTHWCVFSTLATDAMVLKHQAISIHRAD